MHLVGRKKVTILTGKGLSLLKDQSFANQWEFEKKFAGVSDIESVLTKSFFDKNPWAVWEFLYYFV